MADDAITRGGIGGPGSPVYLYEQDNGLSQTRASIFIMGRLLPGQAELINLTDLIF